MHTHTHKEGCVLDLKLQATKGTPMALAYCKLMVFSVGANQVVGKRSNSSLGLDPKQEAARQ